MTTKLSEHMNNLVPMVVEQSNKGDKQTNKNKSSVKDTTKSKKIRKK